MCGTANTYGPARGANLPAMPRPLIGICAAVERARHGPWDELVTLLPLPYPEAVKRAGGNVVLLPPDAAATEAPAGLLDRLDALVLAGGADLDPSSHGAAAHAESTGSDLERDDFEIALASDALGRRLPLLGICRGMQILNVAAGGTLEQHLPDRLGHDGHRPVPGEWTEHDVRLRPGSLAARAVGAERLRVKSHHHQGVDRLGEGVEASGWAEEDDVIEAIEFADREFALGVLWHPEQDVGDRIVPALVEEASRAGELS
jgi:putative glutamine amidotransferase